MQSNPIKDNQRIRIIDAIRGIAILGILLMNVYVGGQYWEANFFPKLISDYKSADFISTILVQSLFEGKMRALFCMLFGAGILLFLQNKKDLSKSQIRKLHFTRMFWLALFGFFNGYVLLFKYDILFMYAVAGLVLIFLKDLRIRYKLLAMPLIILIGLIKSNLDYHQERNEYLKGLDAAVQLAPNNGGKEYLQDLQQEEKLMKGSYLETAEAVYPHVFDGQTTDFIERITDNIPLMLLGMALFQLGFFTNGWSTSQYRKTMIIGYFVGIPLVIYDWYFLLEIQNNDEARNAMYQKKHMTYHF